MKYEKAEKKERYTTLESWHGEAEGFDFWITRESDRGIEFGAQPSKYREEGKIPLFRCRPRHVDDLDRLADEMPKVFRAIAKEMREAGLVDLRSKWDRHDDEMNAWREEMRKAIEEGREIPPFKGTALE